MEVMIFILLLKEEGEGCHKYDSLKAHIKLYGHITPPPPKKKHII